MKSSESWIVGAPNRHLFGAGVCDDYGPRNVPEGLTEPGPLTDEATPHGVLVNVLGPAVPAFIVTALVSGKAGVRDLARRSFRWRVPLRWYLISLFAPLLIFLIAVTILYARRCALSPRIGCCCSPHSCRRWRS
jgi:hypothetical protein